MIVAIADDFTGAAELGGIALRYGLEVEIHTTVPAYTGAELLIIATDTRSMSAGEASDEITRIVKKSNVDNTGWLFKKTDSVLRGHILEELRALKQILRKDEVLLVPSNPSMGRIISGGSYYIDGRPLHKTQFVHDLKGKPRTSKVPELLGAKPEEDICVLKPGQAFGRCSLVVGEATCAEDIKKWAQRGVAGRRILAGAADFFSALLEVKGNKRKESASYAGDASPVSPALTLFVCGSASDSSRNNIEKAKKRGDAVSEAPAELLNADDVAGEPIDKWAKAVTGAFKSNDRVILAINRPLIQNPGVSDKLRACMAKVTEKVLRQVKVTELLIEGGATASSIIQRIDLHRFTPLKELAPGVIRMQPADHPELHITLKPGSYPWPGTTWNPENED